MVGSIVKCLSLAYNGNKRCHICGVYQVKIPMEKCQVEKRTLYNTNNMLVTKFKVAQRAEK